MNRREHLSALLLALASPTLARAQTQPPAQTQPRSQTGAPPMSGPALPTGAENAEELHAIHTLEAGTASLEASRVAISKGNAPMVKRFAQMESAEQQTVTTLLKSRLGTRQGAKPVSAEGKGAVDKLHDIKTGPEFDRAYIAQQIEGHQRLLEIQETYLGTGKEPSSVAIATLARGHIQEHLASLAIIQKDLAG
jgi:putative membrane protein